MTREEAEAQIQLATKSADDQRKAAQAVGDSVANFADLAVLRNAAASVPKLVEAALAGNPTQ